MAHLRKRKAIDYAEHDDDEFNGSTTPDIADETYENDPTVRARQAKQKEKERKRRWSVNASPVCIMRRASPIYRSIEKKNTKPKIRIPSYNVWDKLPGELKNKIYDLVLVNPQIDNNPVFVGSEYEETPGRQDGEKRRYRAWRQPSLFFVSKTIREEAIIVYFQCNRFKISFKTRHLATCFDWIFRYIVPHTTDLMTSLNEIWITSIHAWRKSPHWFVMANFIFHANTLALDDFLRGLRTREKAQEDEIEDWHAVMCLDEMFNDLVVLIVKAKYRQVGNEQFQEDVKDWARLAGVIYSDRLEGREAVEE